MAKKQKQVKEKPLEKMTAKELREIAKEMPEISGAHGMNKPELIAAVKEVRGIVDEKAGKSDASVRDIKKKIKTLKEKRHAVLEDSGKEAADIYRKRISRLKKKTRRAA